MVGFKTTAYDKFKSFNPGKGIGGEKWFRPSFPSIGKNKYVLRVVPPVDGDEISFPAISAPIHYFSAYPGKPPAGVTPGVSPSVNGKFDLAADIFFKLLPQFNTKDLKKTAVFKALKKLAPDTRVYMNVVCLQFEGDDIPEESRKPQTFSMTWAAWNSFKEEWDHYVEQGEPLDDLQSGRNLTLIADGGSSPKAPPKGYSWKVDIKSSPFPMDVDLAAELAPNLKDLSGVSDPLTEEQCRNWVRPVLGEFFDEIVKEYEKETGQTVLIPEWAAPEEEEDEEEGEDV